MFSDVAMPTVDVSAVSPLAGMGAEAGMDFGMSFGMPGGGSGMSNIPPSMAGRCSMGQRMARLKESGATTACEAAVRNALRFLRENQNEDGSFGKEYPAAMTGLSVLAFLGHCETPDSVEFGNSVTKATLYLMERAAKSEGDLVISADTNPRGHGVEYEHAITTYALCEMYTMTKASGASARIPRLESSMKKAVKKIIDAQVGSGPHEGGWAYGYGTGHIDTSVSGWNFQALKSATFTGESIAGLDKALDKAADYFKRAQQPNGGIPYKLGEGAPKPSLTPVGALVFEMWKMEDSKESAKAFEWLGANVLGKGAPQVYGWYYTQQAYFLEGGEPWKKWNQFAMEKILKTQQGDGSFNMSPGHGPKDPASAKVYMTTLCTLMLEVYYRYLPTTQKNLGGNRAGG
jgi:hypothetical protein